MTDVNRHGRETISAKDQHPPLRAALPELEQRHDHELHEREDANHFDHAESRRRHPHRRRYATGGVVLRHRRGRVRDRERFARAVAEVPVQCTTIKNRGIRIAVLYTTYLPLPIGHS
jgi:hypothetical protein